jgi:hypothetical protein
VLSFRLTDGEFAQIGEFLAANPVA